MRRESNPSVEVELLGQVQLARQMFLNASDDCLGRARRHYRKALGVFNDLILNGGTSDRAKAARYLNLLQRVHQDATVHTRR
jgi:hypothetical protein